MRKIILIAAGGLLSAGAAFSQTTPEEGTGVKNKPRRHSVGARLSISSSPLVFAGDSAKVEDYEMFNHQFQYLYEFAKRLYVGANYSNLTEPFRHEFPYRETAPSSNPIEKAVLRISATSVSLRLSLAADLVTRANAALRLSVHLPLYRGLYYRKSFENASKNSDILSNHLPPGEADTGGMFKDKSSFFAFNSPEFTLDLIIRYDKHSEIGVSPYLNFTVYEDTSLTKLGGYVTYNYRF